MVKLAISYGVRQGSALLSTEQPTFRQLDIALQQKQKTKLKPISVLFAFPWACFSYPSVALTPPAQSWPTHKQSQIEGLYKNSRLRWVVRVDTGTPCPTGHMAVPVPRPC